MIETNDVPWKVGVGEKIWALRGNPEQFKNTVREMLELCYPGFIPIKATYPFILCRVDRELRRRRLAEEAAKWEKK